MQIKLHANINIETIYKYFADLLSYNLHHCKFRQTDRQSYVHTYIHTNLFTYIQTYLHTGRQADWQTYMHACIHMFISFFLPS